MTNEEKKPDTHFHSAQLAPICGAVRSPGLLMATFWEAVTCGECLRLGKVVREKDEH